MTLADIFESESPVCVEQTLMGCADSGYDDFLLSTEYDGAKLLVDEDENPIAAALHNISGWTVASYLYRPFCTDILDLVDKFNGDIYQEERNTYAKALREYYAGEIVKEFPDANEDNRPGRFEMIESLFDSLNLRLPPESEGQVSAIDFCCGSGVATSVLRSMGYETLSFDYDASLVSIGIQKGRLIPSDVMCLDGTAASDFCPECTLGTGLMLGDITNFNTDMWEDIISELFALSSKTVISTATKPEIEKVADWARDEGRRPKVIQNDRDPIYDAWVCISEE